MKISMISGSSGRSSLRIYFRDDEIADHNIDTAARYVLHDAGVIVGGGVWVKVLPAEVGSRIIYDPRGGKHPMHILTFGRTVKNLDTDAVAGQGRFNATETALMQTEDGFMVRVPTVRIYSPRTRKPDIRQEVLPVPEPDPVTIAPKETIAHQASPETSILIDFERRISALENKGFFARIFGG